MSDCKQFKCEYSHKRHTHDRVSSIYVNGLTVKEKDSQIAKSLNINLELYVLVVISSIWSNFDCSTN